MSRAASVMAVVSMDSVFASAAQAEDLVDVAEFQVCFGSEPNALCRMAFDHNNGAREINQIGEDLLWPVCELS